MKLQLQITKDATAHDVRRLVKTAKALGATNLRALFPGANNPDALKRLFVVDAPDSLDAEHLIASLNKEDSVQFVESESARKLIKPMPSKGGKGA